MHTSKIFLFLPTAYQHKEGDPPLLAFPAQEQAAVASWLSRIPFEVVAFCGTIPSRFCAAACASGSAPCLEDEKLSADCSPRQAFVASTYDKEAYEAYRAY